MSKTISPYKPPEQLLWLALRTDAELCERVEFARKHLGPSRFATEAAMHKSIGHGATLRAAEAVFQYGRSLFGEIAKTEFHAEPTPVRSVVSTLRDVKSVERLGTLSERISVPTPSLREKARIVTSTRRVFQVSLKMNPGLTYAELYLTLIHIKILQPRKAIQYLSRIQHLLGFPVVGPRLVHAHQVALMDSLQYDVALTTGSVAQIRSLEYSIVDLRLFTYNRLICAARTSNQRAFDYLLKSLRSDVGTGIELQGSIPFVVSTFPGKGNGRSRFVTGFETLIT